MEAIQIREARREDAGDIHDLYRSVARKPGGLARLETEIPHDYIAKLQQNAALSGLMLIATERSGGDTLLVGEIHAITPPLYCFSHVLSELTIAVHPERQGSGIGRALFIEFMQRVQKDYEHITRVELISRESNTKALSFYESLGFEREGAMRNRIKNIDGSLECDIPMAWLRPE